MDTVTNATEVAFDAALSGLSSIITVILPYATAMVYGALRIGWSLAVMAAGTYKAVLAPLFLLTILFVPIVPAAHILSWWDWSVSVLCVGWTALYMLHLKKYRFCREIASLITGKPDTTDRKPKYQDMQRETYHAPPQYDAGRDINHVHARTPRDEGRREKKHGLHNRHATSSGEDGASFTSTGGTRPSRRKKRK